MADLAQDKRIQTIVLVDSSWLLYRSYFAYQGIRPSAFIGDTEVYAGDIFGFTTTVMDLRKLMPQAVIFLCLDGRQGSSSLRGVCPEYKANRVKRPEVFEKYDEILQATALIPGVFVVVDEGFEADEVICAASELWNRAGVRVVIYGSDKDLNQVLRGRDIVRASLIRNNQFDDLYTEDSFHADYGAMPTSAFPMFQAIVGDKRTDNYAGYPRFHKRVAARIAAVYHTPDALLGADSLALSPSDAKAVRVILENPELLRRNYYVAKARPIAKITAFKVVGDAGVVQRYQLRRFWRFLHDLGVVDTERWEGDEAVPDAALAYADLSFDEALDD